MEKLIVQTRKPYSSGLDSTAGHSILPGKAGRRASKLQKLVSLELTSKLLNHFKIIRKVTAARFHL